MDKPLSRIIMVSAGAPAVTAIQYVEGEGPWT
jgi:hypothetical protein